ncbi:MAG: ATP-binding protein [Porticoccaceae bacterium]
MKRLYRLFLSRIDNKLIMLSVIPVAVVTAIITWHTIDTRRAEIQDFQTRTALMLAKNLAKNADFALYSGRGDILEPLAVSAQNFPSVVGVYFLDANRELLLAPELPSELDRDMLKQGSYSDAGENVFVVEEPVYLIPMDLDDYGDEVEQESSSLLGWVVVVADNSESAAKSREILITHLLISFSVLLGAVLLTYMLSNTVVSPIRAMTAVVRELERGNLDVRILPSTGDELAILANGINHLAETVAEGRETLENKVELSTHRLTMTLEDLKRKNRELELARREAEEASTAKGDFLAQMSHELRTPITAIQGFIRLLASSDLRPAEARYCAIIQQASVQLLQLIDDILDITRLQSNAIILDRAPFNLAECIEAPVSLMAPSAHEKGLELILDIAPNVPYTLLGDSLRLRQIVNNLVSNAIKFTPAGYVLVKVKASAHAGERMTLLLQVIDTGIGIPDRQQTGLFEPFSQADSSISRRFGGSGLGLSIVRRLVELMDGDIRLDSTTGKGSTFTLALPLEVQSGDDVPKSAPATRCVLLFDTHPQSRQALENILGRYVEVIESCDSFADLEINELHMTPELIVYSPRVEQTLADIEEDIRRLRAVSDSPIAVLIPTTPIYKKLPEHFLDDYQPIQFLDKPPMSAELSRCFGRADAEAGGERGAMLDARILVAEDNEFTRILLSTFFEHTDCQLVLTKNGREAIDVCREQRFDLILMDVRMPEVNGIEAVREVRRDSLNRDTPIIMLTADILQQEENALFDVGASDVVFKPFDEGKLLAAVRKHLRRTLVEQVARTSPDADKEQRRRLFASEVARLTDVARQALEDQDVAVLQDAIHQLLGIAGVYRMAYLERAVQALHQAVKAGSDNKAVAAMETLILEVEKLQTGKAES